MRIWLPNGDELEYLTDLTCTVQTEDGQGFEAQVAHMSIIHPAQRNDDEPVIVAPDNCVVDIVVEKVDPEAIKILFGVDKLWTP